MALNPIFKVMIDCEYDGFSIIQLTGTYNATTNTGGYGSPNITVADVDSTSLIIKNLTENITYDAITSISASQYYTITNFNITDLKVSGTSSFTSGDPLPDGVYEFSFKVIDGSTIYTYTCRVGIIRSLKCTLAKANQKIVDDSCGCIKKDFLDKYYLGFAYITGLEGLEICSDLTAYSNLYDKVENYLNNNLKCNC